ncbi:MAG: PilZ domain-containing protein [Candidatus Omnitrophota bacterium]|nr:PilZ domain-containing protein [Candidatus Omnitrophota bacterium]
MHILFFIFLAVLLFIIYIISSREEKKAKSKYEPRGKLEEYCANEKNRRRCQRFETTLDVKYKLLKSSKSNPAFSSKDISEVGIGILTYEIIPKDALLEMDIAIPTQKEPLRIKGKVAWCEGCEGAKRLDKEGKRVFMIGVEFFETDKDQRAKLIEYINTHLVSKNEKELQD